jgi:iron complex outermembrane receptor protein
MGNEGDKLYDFQARKSTPLVGFSAGYTYQATDGNEYFSFDASRRMDEQGAYRQFQVNDSRATHTSFLLAEGAGALTGLSLQMHFSRWNFETGHGWLYRVPDESERALNGQEMISGKYRPRLLLKERLQLEVAASYQRTIREYRVKLLPDSSTFAGTPLPNGITEIAHGVSREIFSRVQADYRVFTDMHLLLGLENSLYFSQSGSAHQSNFDVDRDGTFTPFPDGQLHDLKPTFEPILGRPIKNLGFFLQASTGRFWNNKVSATGGVRYDFLDADYRDFKTDGFPLTNKFLDQFSPRIALVYLPTENISIKAMSEKAFRAPTAAELFATNSLLGFSNPGPLQPEIMTAHTLAVDALLFSHFNLRVDGFIQQFENQIAFSGSQNATSNIYSRTINGVESELRFESGIGAGFTLAGFINHTLSHQISEKVLEPGIAPSGRLTWAPEHVGNLGVVFTGHGLTASLQAHYQGTVYRRTSDFLGADGLPTAFSDYRPRSLEPWTTLDIGLGYRFIKGAAQGWALKAKATNVLDEVGYLMKLGNYPFDYRIESLRIHAMAEYTFALTTSNRENTAAKSGYGI